MLLALFGVTEGAVVMATSSISVLGKSVWHVAFGPTGCILPSLSSRTFHNTPNKEESWISAVSLALVN